MKENNANNNETVKNTVQETATQQNVSKSSFTMVKKDGQEKLTLHVNNSTKEQRELKLDVKDAGNGRSLSIFSNGTLLINPLMIPPLQTAVLLIDVKNVDSYVRLETVRTTQGAMSIRQRNTSKNGVITEVLELLLK